MIYVKLIIVMIVEIGFVIQLVKGLLKMCNHKNAYVEKSTIGCGYYGYCPDCEKEGPYRQDEMEAKYEFELKYDVVILYRINRTNGF